MTLAAVALCSPRSLSGLPGSKPDWRTESAYAHLGGADPASIAWEWLRRDARYRACYMAWRTGGPGAAIGAVAWGLCAYCDPDQSFEVARPQWHRSAFPLVLPVAATRGRFADTIDLSHLVGGPIAVIPGRNGTEHCLFIGRGCSLRFDMVEGSLVDGPFLPRFLLEGRTRARRLLPVLEQFLLLARSGELRPISTSRAWSQRRILELRTRDALCSGAAQREIAAVLIDPDAHGPRWRVGLSSIRSRAQRLVRAARRMDAGGWKVLLGANDASWPVDHGPGARHVRLVDAGASRCTLVDGRSAPGSSPG